MPPMDATPQRPGKRGAEETRRDFLFVSAGAFAAVGSAVALWPVIDSFNPAADVRAEAELEVDLAPITPGQRITVRWQGRPIFIEHRTNARIAASRSDDAALDLIDPERDQDRVRDPKWLVVIGICTHLGCVPLGQRVSDRRGSFGGWFCPCHGSVYDGSGRVRRGPAPRNLLVPPYKFLDDRRILIG